MTPSTPECGPLVDTHAHLDDPGLRNDLKGVLDRARAAGIVQIIAVGTTARDSESVSTITSQHNGVFATVGVQPNHVTEAKAGDWQRIVELASRPRVVAIGETGLDRYWDYTPFAQQQEWFDRHLTLAEELCLPVVIHSRDCEADIIEQLRQRSSPIRGVLHSFTGSTQHAAAFVELGLYISLAGMVTFSNKKLDILRAAAATVPLDRILIETDSPYLSPHPLRGRPNQPSHLPWTAERLAAILGLTPTEFAQATTSNAQQLFRLPADETLGSANQAICDNP